MSSRRQRPSFLRPLTQIAPQPTAATRSEGAPTPGRDAILGPASMGSVASATYGPRPRSKSLVAREAKVGHAPPTSSVGDRTGSVGAAISLPSSRRSSFVSGHRRMSTREPTVSRRGSIWSEFGDEAPSGGIELNDEQKAHEAQKAFANSTKLLWEGGVDVMVTNAWAALTACWKKGDIVGLVSIDNLGLPRLEHATAVVLIDELQSRFQSLATSTFSSPEAIEALKFPTSKNFDALFAFLIASPTHLALLLRVLETSAKLALRVLPPIRQHLGSPDSVTDLVESVLNLVTFLTGSSTDLRRTLVTGVELLGALREVLDSVNKAIVHVTATAPSGSDTIGLHPSRAFLYSFEHTVRQFDEIQAHFLALTAQPSFAAAKHVFCNEIMSLWKGLVGNARVARASRGVERIWNDPASSLRIKVSSLLEGLDAIGWELDPVASDNEEFSYSFSSLRPRLPSLLPEDISFSYSAGIGTAHTSPTIISLRGLRLVIEGATYEITKRGLLGFSDSGSASLTILFDLDISLETNGHPKARVAVEKQDIVLESSRKPDSVVGKVWNGWLSTLVRAKFAESIDERIESAFEAWIEPFYNTPAASKASAGPSAPPQEAAKTTDTIHAVGKSPLPSASGPMGARAAFLASLRMTSGISVRPLATGRDVLDSLENPFGSGPNSAAMGDGNDDEEASSSGGLKSRRMSMAMSLTDLSRGDATALDTIANPPRAQSQPHLALDEPSASSSLTARRLSLAYTPAGEPSLEAYDSEYATVASSIDPHIPSSGRERRRSTVMADSLDAKAEADGTTLEGMLATAHRANTSHGFDITRDITSSRQNISMAKVTRDLQGQEQTDLPGAIISTPDKRTESTDVPKEQSKTRRKSMSEYLTEAASADTTDPTVYPGPRRPLAYDPGLQDHPRPFMSEALDATSSIDTTLPEHIASPPRSRHSSFATGAFVGGGVNSGPFPRNRTKSFVELTDVPTMAELGIDKDVIRDETDITSLPPSRSRRQSTTADEYAGLDDSELKKRTMSSWMTIASNLDTTLIENIAAPPMVDQTYYEIAAQPHPLHQRRASMVATYVA